MKRGRWPSQILGGVLLVVLAQSAAQATRLQFAGARAELVINEVREHTLRV